MKYPANCIKGIPNNSVLDEDGSVGAHLFHFKDEHKRADEWVEQSINWEDDESAIDFTLKQKKENGELQFKAGAAILPCSGIDWLKNRPPIKGFLSYERDPLTNNPYHGNILLKADVPKPKRKMIGAGLALVVSEIIPQNQDGSNQ